MAYIFMGHILTVIPNGGVQANGTVCDESDAYYTREQIKILGNIFFDFEDNYNSLSLS